MKKKFIALLLIASTFATSSSLILAKETNLIKEEIVLEKNKQKPIVMLRESDWGDENYGNWKEIAKHPENYKKVTACMLKKMALLGIDFSVQEVLGMLATGSAIYYLGIKDVIALGSCLFG